MSEYGAVTGAVRRAVRELRGRGSAELAQATGLPLRTVAATLRRLELHGHVARKARSSRYGVRYAYFDALDPGAPL